jgi:hypothetical protein
MNGQIICLSRVDNLLDIYDLDFNASTKRIIDCEMICIAYNEREGNLSKQIIIADRRKRVLQYGLSQR